MFCFNYFDKYYCLNVGRCLFSRIKSQKIYCSALYRTSRFFGATKNY